MRTLVDQELLTLREHGSPPGRVGPRQEIEMIERQPPVEHRSDDERHVTDPTRTTQRVEPRHHPDTSDSTPKPVRNRRRAAADGRIASTDVPVVSMSVSTRRYEPSSPAADWAIRLSRCVGGLALFGLGISLIIEAHLGAAPWDVFHQGVAEKTGISIGTVIVITGVLLLLIWIPLKQKPGIGTILNALEIGLTVDLVIPLVPDTDLLVVRAGYLIAGIVIIAVGSGLYIGSGLGAGPRDGIMIGLGQRGMSVRLARTLVEITVLVLGVLMGGVVGIGTVAFTLGIGPLVQIFLPRFALPPRRHA